MHPRSSASKKIKQNSSSREKITKFGSIRDRENQFLNSPRVSCSMDVDRMPLKSRTSNVSAPKAANHAKPSCFLASPRENVLKKNIEFSPFKNTCESESEHLEKPSEFKTNSRYCKNKHNSGSIKEKSRVASKGRSLNGGFNSRPRFNIDNQRNSRENYRRKCTTPEPELRSSAKRSLGKARLRKDEAFKNTCPWMDTSKSFEITPSSNVCLDISGFKPNDSEYSVKQLFRGIHVVSLTAQIDNLTGECVGNAEVLIKCSDNTLKKFKNSLAVKGYEVSTKTPRNGKMDNYKDLATTNFLNTFTTGRAVFSPFRRPDLESSADLFGSSPGVGRSYYTKQESSDFRDTFMWDYIRKSSTSPSPRNSILNYTQNCSYMKNQEAYSKKGQKFNN